MKSIEDLNSIKPKYDKNTLNYKYSSYQKYL